MLPEGLAISVITFSEIFEGIFTGRDPVRAEQAFQTFLQGVQVLDITQEIALENARLRGELRALRRQISHRALDLLIAATAITYSLILVTRNVEHYRDIPRLRLYELPQPSC